jgi:hypothetical protein
VKIDYALHSSTFSVSVPKLKSVDKKTSFKEELIHEQLIVTVSGSYCFTIEKLNLILQPKKADILNPSSEVIIRPGIKLRYI